MAEARGRAQRRLVREKATIDHLVRDVYEPNGKQVTTRPARAAYPLFDDSHRLTSITGQNLCIV